MQKGVDVEADDGIGFEDNEQFQDLSLQQLHEALDLLDAADIDAYREAKRHAPDLVALESDPRRFLRVENFNPWAAARRLASYWTIRKSIFGEKSLFPLRGTKGAFTEDDLRNIKSGVFQILPNDLYGHSVLFFDETKLELHTPRGFAKRIFFFLQMLSENQLSQSKGFTLVVALDKVGRISEKPGREFATDLVEQSMPLKLNDFHLLCCRPREEWTTALEKHIPKALHFLEKCVTLRAPNVHIDETHTGILHKMLNFGFEKESLPAVAGGTWDRSEFEKWLEKYDMRLTETSFSQLTECAFSDLIKETVVHYQLKVDSVDESSSVPTDDNSAINRDLYGPLSLPDIASTAEIKTSMESRRQLDEALDLIPIEQKHAFAEAKQCVPNLIETESNPIRFLEAENYNVWAAAKRLVAYWKYRKDFFGDRAFFPMLLSDTGRTAISQEDMVFLKTTGFVAILPNDRYDRVVIYNDRDKLGSTAQHSYKHRFRAFFYGLQLASEMDASRSNGLVLITDFGFAATERPTNNKNSALVMEFLKSGALPVNLKALHVIVRSEKNRWLNTYMVPAAMKALDNFRFLSLRTLVHVGKTRDVLRSKLEPFGFTDDSLPYHCGGTWKFEVDFEQWWQLRKMSDEISFRGSRVSDKKQVRPAYQKSSKDVEEAKPSTDAKVIKKRKMDIVYARRKREKERIEIGVLQEQLRALEADNFQLRGENERFESLLLVATHAAEIYEKKNH